MQRFEHQIDVDPCVRAFIDPDGGIAIKAVEFTPGSRGDPVEISSTQARELGEALILFADIEDAESPQSPSDGASGV